MNERRVKIEIYDCGGSRCPDAPLDGHECWIHDAEDYLVAEYPDATPYLAHPRYDDCWNLTKEDCCDIAVIAEAD